MKTLTMRRAGLVALPVLALGLAGVLYLAGCQSQPAEGSWAAAVSGGGGQEGDGRLQDGADEGASSSDAGSNEGASDSAGAGASPSGAYEPGAAALAAADVPTALAEVPAAYLLPSVEGGTLERFYYDTNTYDDEARDMEKFAIVYLPYGYDPANTDTRYNVLYLMHGAGGSESGYLGTPADPGTDKALLDNMIANGDMEPMIVVGISYYPDNVEQDNDDYDAALTKAFGAELRKDLVPQLESSYKTYLEGTDDESLRASRAHRVFGGFSMGGVTTWYRMADTMDYFQYFFPMSGSLFWSSEAYSKGGISADFIADYLSEGIAGQGFGKAHPFASAATGSADFAVGGLDGQMDALKKKQELFRFSDTADYANSVYLVADGKEHDGAGRRMYIYNALPVFSELMN